MKIQKIMTRKVLTLKQTDTLHSAIKKFAKKGVHGAPVINGYGHAIGVVSNADLTGALNTATPSAKITSSKMLGLVFASLRSKKEEDQLRGELQESKKVKVKNFMSAPIVINQNASIMQAINEMVNNDINRLPVVNSKNKVVGIVTRTDIIKALDKDYCK